MTTEDRNLGIDVGNVTVLAETAKAVLCSWDDGEEHWIPKSAIDVESEVYEQGERGVLIIPKWLAEKLGKCDKYGYTEE